MTRKSYYGGGCAESLQLKFLFEQDRSIARDCLIHVFTFLIRSLYRKSVFIDRINGHLWISSENDEDQLDLLCGCQLYQSTTTFQLNWRNYVVHLDDQISMIDEKNLSDKLFIKLNYPKFLDSYSMKSQTLKTATETAINLLLTKICL